MTIREALDYIHIHPEIFLKRDKSGHGWICPCCGSGSGRHGTGITSRPGDPDHFTCWAGCFTSADVLDIIGLAYGKTSFQEKLAAAAGIYNLRIEWGPDRSALLHTHGKAAVPKREILIEPEEDLREYFASCQKNLEMTAYHEQRGISQRTAERFQLGFDPAWRHPKVANSFPSPRLIVPTSGSSYLARDTRAGMRSFAKAKVGRVHLLNLEAALQQKKPVFVVEGEFDALSVIEAGQAAIALGSTANVRKLMRALSESTNRPPMVLCLDNDQAGRACTEALRLELERLHVPHTCADITGSSKDPNEALIVDRASFTDRVAAAVRELPDKITVRLDPQIASIPKETPAQFRERALQVPGTWRDPDRFAAFLRFFAANLQMDAANALGAFDIAPEARNLHTRCGWNARGRTVAVNAAAVQIIIGAVMTPVYSESCTTAVPGRVAAAGQALEKTEILRKALRPAMQAAQAQPEEMPALLLAWIRERYPAGRRTEFSVQLTACLVGLALGEEMIGAPAAVYLPQLRDPGKLNLLAGAPRIMLRIFNDAARTARREIAALQQEADRQLQTKMPDAPKRLHLSMAR